VKSTLEFCENIYYRIHHQINKYYRLSVLSKYNFSLSPSSRISQKYLKTRRKIKSLRAFRPRILLISILIIEQGSTDLNSDDSPCLTINPKLYPNLAFSPPFGYQEGCNQNNHTNPQILIKCSAKKPTSQMVLTNPQPYVCHCHQKK
jgi:hypothetical protein